MYRVKLSFWTRPVMVEADSIYHARQVALEQYRDSNGKPGRVEWIGKISASLNRYAI